MITLLRLLLIQLVFIHHVDPFKNLIKKNIIRPFLKKSQGSMKIIIYFKKGILFFIMCIIS